MTTRSLLHFALLVTFPATLIGVMAMSSIVFFFPSRQGTAIYLPISAEMLSACLADSHSAEPATRRRGLVATRAVARACPSAADRIYPEIAQLLEHDDVKTRVLAIEILGELGPGAKPVADRISRAGVAAIPFVETIIRTERRRILATPPRADDPFLCSLLRDASRGPVAGGTCRFPRPPDGVMEASGPGCPP